MIEWGGERDALTEIVHAKLRRYVDLNRHPPRTKKARDLIGGDVVQYGGERRVVEHVMPYSDSRIHVCWINLERCTVYPCDAEIALGVT